MPDTAQNFPLLWIPLFPLIGAVLNLLLGRALGKKFVTFVSCGSVAASFLVVVAAVLQLHGMWDATAGEQLVTLVHEPYTWIESGSLSLGLKLVVDPLTAIMIFTITFVGFLIHVYSTGYMAHDPRYHTYFGYLNLFTGSMLILVLGGNLPIMFIGWEGVGVCSYLLIGFWYDKEKNANAGRKAFVVNRIGDFSFLLGVFILFDQTGTLDFTELRAHAAAFVEPFSGTGMSVAFVVGLLLFGGACGKSAQIPLFVWLPDAMAGPTPVSALIHAATMVTAGVYMIARMSFMYALAPGALMIVAGVGALTALVAAAIGFAQTDVKKVLAYSTVSQLGFMFVGVGTGAWVAGIFHLFTHAFFKAGLFLGAGSIMHAFGGRGEIMEMGGLRKHAPYTRWTFFIYCLAIAGIIPFAGFFSKDEVLLGAWLAGDAGFPAWYAKVLWVTLSLAALGTAFYMWRLYFLVFGGQCRAEPEVASHIHESPGSMTVPLVVLAVGATVLGFLGLPHIGHLPNVLGMWLDPVFQVANLTLYPAGHHTSATVVVFLMGVALFLGAAGIFIAWSLYKDGPEKGRRVAAKMGGLYRGARDKFYFDELYHLVIVRPFRWVGAVLYNFVDRVIIDGFVNVVGWFTVGVGRIARLVQNGDVQWYAAALVLGIAAMFVLPGLGHEGFSTESVGANEQVLVADLAGPEQAGARVQWDFDGDGRIDAEGPRVAWRFETPGSHEVTMQIHYASGAMRTETRTIVVGTAVTGEGQ